MRKILLLLFVLFLCFKIGDAQQLTSYEYWFDGNYGAAVSVPLISTPTELLLNEQISTSGLIIGFHFFHIRFQDMNGKYSSVQTKVFNKTTTNNGVTTLINYEYWFDNNYADKISTPIGNLASFDLVSALNSVSLSNGLHICHIRFQDDGGNWSAVISQSFLKAGGGNNIVNIVQTEYWFDNDYANHVDQPANSQPEFILNTGVTAASLTSGLHIAHVRFQDNNGDWSSVISQTFMKYGNIINVTNSVIGYRFWFNSNTSDMQNISLAIPQNPYELMSQISTRNYTNPGFNDLHIQFEDTLGNWSEVLSSTFTRDSIPVAYFTTDAPACLNNPINFNDSTTEADSYFWDFGDGNNSTYYSPTHTYDHAGTFAVTLSTHSSVSGLDSSISHDVVVNPLPSPIISASSTTASCNGDSLSLDAGAWVSYIWTNGSTDEVIYVTSGGTFYVTITDANGCTGIATMTITGTSVPTPSINPNGPTTFCDGGSVLLTTGNYTTYSWSNGATTQSIVATVNGTYRVTVTDINGCSATATQSVTVNPVPVLTITPSGPTSFCIGGSATLDAGVHTSYIWSNGATTESIVVTATGNFTVTVTNSIGCTVSNGGDQPSGGNITQIGGYRIHTFTSSGMFTVPSGFNSNANVLVVGGGGGGGRAGGGGAGGFIETTANLSFGNISVTVGSGGIGSNGDAISDGGNSVFENLIAIGGGGGGGNTGQATPGRSGGSGGGGGMNSGFSTENGYGGSGTVGQGYSGGTTGGEYCSPSGGGGGAGGPGGVGTQNGSGQFGGPGLPSSISGSSVYYAGGGVVVVLGVQV